MTAAELEVLLVTEADRVVLWRCEELARAGYDEDDSFFLATQPDVALHLAVDLIRWGCPMKTALRILL